MFYGFGQDSDALHKLAEKLLPYYTVLHIGLFFHEGNFYKDPVQKQISIEKWSYILNTILIRERLERFDMLGFIWVPDLLYLLLMPIGVALIRLFSLLLMGSMLTSGTGWPCLMLLQGMCFITC